MPPKNPLDRGDRELRQLAKDIADLVSIRDPLMRVATLGPLCDTDLTGVRSRLYRVRALDAVAAMASLGKALGRPASASELAVELGLSKQTAYRLVRDGRMIEHAE